MKKLAFALVMILLTAACGSESEAPVIGTVWINTFEKCPTHAEYGIQVVSGANMWAGKDTNTDRLANILHGTQVDLLEEGESWVKIRHIAAEGYVQKILISDYDPSEGVRPDEDSCL